MAMKQLSPDLYVAPQISVADVDAAAEAGIRTIICNRPDGESPDQPTAAEIREAATDLDLEFHDIPVVSGALSEANVESFAAACRKAPTPVLAYCRSGTRSATLWALAESTDREALEILDAVAVAGYDLSGLRPLLESRRLSHR